MIKMLKRLSSVLTAATMVFTASAVLPSTSAAEDTDIIFQSEGESLGEGAELWTTIYQTEIPGYSGEGFAYLTSNNIKFEVEAPEEGMYAVDVRYAQILDQEGRLQTLTVNGSEYSTVLPYANKWQDYEFCLCRLKKGVNTLEFIPKYGYAAFDTVTVKKASFPELKVSPVLNDKKATREAQSLMNYLCDVYGNGILSGQQTIYGGGHQVTTSIRYDAATNTCVDSDGNQYSFDEADKAVADGGSEFVWKCVGEDGQVYSYDAEKRNYYYNEYDRELKYLENTVGDMPAIQGFDFGSNCPCYQWDDGVVERMIDWTNNKNGICTASWHINVPKVLADYTLGEPLDFLDTTYRPDECDFSPSNAYTEGTAEYDYFQLCIKNLAEQLQRLQDANVPVIFRPLHEADGNYSNGGKAWFWWGKEGPEVYNNLWKFLRSELQDKYGIHNLIWEQNLYTWSDASAEWYSGDDYVDIVGFDKYNTEHNRHDGKTSGPNLDAESGVFWKLYNTVNGNKMVAMPENDTIPALDNIMIEKAGWLYFCPWYDEESSPKFLSGSEYQDIDELKKIYTSDYCITLSELPDWKNYEAGTNPDIDFIPGDVNDDGKVNVFDSVIMRRKLEELYPDPDAEYALMQPYASSYDVTGDGQIMVDDLVLLNEFILGKDVQLKYYTGE